MLILYATAMLVGFVHTLLGPDHYLPFVGMSKAGGWSMRKTLRVTALCGLGHVLGSVLLGIAGAVFGLSLSRLVFIESVRGDFAGWMLVAFGLAFLVWGVRRAIRQRPHEHVHLHADGTMHKHPHTHTKTHVHVHERSDAPGMASWWMFVIFIFGPCEPLIPLLIYPAAQGGGMWPVVFVALLFSLTTVATMLVAVWAGVLGLDRVRWGIFERYAHAMAGLIILLSGVAVVAGL
jgi:sulfite exporter TauE/SafE